MAAKRNLRGYLREYGYNDDPPGLTVIAKQGNRYNHLYDDITPEENVALFSRGTDGEWLVTMRMSDFMEIYKAWETDKGDV